MLAILVSASVGGAFYLWLDSPLATLDQHIAAATASLTAGALVIAVGAGVVALLAFRDALRKPLLRMSVGATEGQFSEVNASLVNDGTASARNAIVWLDVQGTAEVMNLPRGWTQEPTGGLLRWEAGAGVAVHPKVPPLTLPPITMRRFAEHVKISYTFAADGFGPDKGTFPD